MKARWIPIAAFASENSLARPFMEGFIVLGTVIR